MRKSCLIIALLIASCPALFGQTTFGTIVGSVTDTSGAAVASAQVTLTNIGTSKKRTVTADSAGDYESVNLIPAQYRIGFFSPSAAHRERSFGN